MTDEELVHRLGEARRRRETARRYANLEADRELVLEAVKGKSNRWVARHLGVSETAIRNLLRKVGE